ncbi:hypothetical protein [Microvirga calopogonii]|uniref:hypothetical protein n=1 Tax=Microvirga calopogonii TaxID=2078013 RepID=UPI0013B4367B|nr:hypothetical protein [Microvirga calopogonii]
MTTLEIQNLDFDYILREPDTEVLIDRDQDVVVVAGDHPFKELAILYYGQADLLGVRTATDQVEFPDGFGLGKRVVVAGVEIGTVSYADEFGIAFEFNASATAAQVQTIIRSLTYKDTSQNTDFTASDDIYISLNDTAGQAALALVRIGDNVIGTAESDTFIATQELIGAGDRLQGGDGNDMLVLNGGGSFNLHLMAGLESIETIEGTSFNDFVTLTAEQLAGVALINGKGHSATVMDRLTVKGSNIDLTGKTITGFDIHLATNGAEITVDSVDKARLVHGYDTSNDKLVLTTGTLGEDERLALHRQGIDTVVARNANGDLVETTHTAPEITRFGEANVIAAIGTSTFLDAGRDSVLRVDSGLLHSLSLHVEQGSHGRDVIDVDQSGGVTLLGQDVYVGGTDPENKIGYFFALDSSSLSFTFNDRATTARVQQLIQALTYTASAGQDGQTRTITMYIRDVALRQTTAQVTVEFDADGSPDDPDDPNEAPTGLELLGTSIREGSATGIKVGDLSATDAPGTILTYTLLDNAGGRFAIGADGKSIVVANGTLLDHEQAQSHVIKVQVSDGDLTATKEFTIQVSDVNEDPVSLNLIGVSVREAIASGTKIGDLTAVDPEGHALTYALLDNAGGRFAIGADGKSIVVANGTLLDHEQAQSHVIKVQVSDGTLTSVKEFTIQVSDWTGETVTGTSSHDVVAGGSGNDAFAGGLGDDKLKGDAGNDTLKGDDGADMLSGGDGNDTLFGGAGNDIFVFDVKPHKKTNYDTVKDYNVKQDSIHLDHAAFTKLGTGSASLPKMLKAKHFKLSTQQQDKDDYIIYNKGTGVLYYDANGSAAGGRTEIAKFSNKPLLKASEFFVI